VSEQILNFTALVEKWRELLRRLRRNPGLIVYCTPLSLLSRLAFRGNWDYFRMNKPKDQQEVLLYLATGPLQFLAGAPTMPWEMPTRIDS
jgi:hypothetical protein